MGEIIGLGGVFIKFDNPEEINLWYKNVLHLNVNDYGVLFSFNHSNKKRAFLQLGTFDYSSDYFGEQTQKVMLNFRVSKLEEFIEELKLKKVKILDEMETYEYGKFIHIEDPEGNRIELWEPVDEEFEKSGPYHEMF